MNKLTKILFTRPIARDVIPFRDSGEVIPVCRRARRALICVWTLDPETGRLVCSWSEAVRCGGLPDAGRGESLLPRFKSPHNGEPS